MDRVRVVAMAAMVMLTACHGERATITGEYGMSVIQGAVVVAGMENTSPAGIEVSLRGSGMSLTLDAAGAFTFSGVPDQTSELVFRRGDGINATLAVARDSGFVAVELSAKGARKVPSKRRSTGSPGKKTHEFEGVVRSASATELVVFTSHREEVTIVLDAATVVRKGQATVDPATLAAGTRVHVKARKEGDVYTAMLVLVQNAAEEDDDGGDDAATKGEYQGIVRSASESELVVFTSHKVEETFTLNSATVIRKGNTRLTAADLDEGDRVHVKADAAKVAILVIVQGKK